jgi:hypothetical protein
MKQDVHILEGCGLSRISQLSAEAARHPGVFPSAISNAVKRTMEE